MADKETFPCWGYREGEAKIFEVEVGGKLPRGWVDNPDKVKPAKAEANDENGE